MGPGSRSSPSSVSRRPRDRKDQIAGTAARLFAELGYHRVGVDDVAAAVGITGGAIYRHFGTKADLLARTVADALDTVEGAIDVSDGKVPAQLFDGLVPLGLEQPHLATLLDREARHVPPADLEEYRRRLGAVIRGLADALRRTRPDLTADDATLLVRSALAVVASPSSQRVAVPSAEAEAVLRSTVGTVLTATTADPSADRPLPRAAAQRASRREALLAAATTLFARQGYQAVTLEEIGAAAGIAGTSIYQHFAGKADLLGAAFNRGAEWLQFGLSQALAAATGPADALALVVHSYVDFILAHADLIGLLLMEAVHLPDGELRLLRRTQHDYVTEWVNVLMQARPELTEPEARFRVHVALAIVNDVARPGRPAPQPSLHGRLCDLAAKALRA